MINKLSTDVKVLALEDGIKEGRLVIFQGLLKDCEGKRQLQENQKADIHWLANMNFFVKGI